MKENTVAKIINDTFIDMSITYAKFYKENPNAFLNSFKKYPSIQMGCSLIVSAYKNNGLFNECKKNNKSFEEYANNFVSDKSLSRVLSDYLLILYSIVKED